MSEQPMSIEHIAAIFNAEVLSDAETTELAERAELARQSDLVDEWNRHLAVTAPEPDEPDETTAEVLRQLESDGLVTPGQTYEEAFAVIKAAEDGKHSNDEPSTGITLIDASLVRPRPVTWAWEGRLVLGALNLLVGLPSKNKSTLATDLVARLTRGQLPGDLSGKPSLCFIASAEDTRDHTLVPRLMAAGADLSLVRFLTYFVDDTETGIILPKHVDQLEVEMREQGAAFTVIDPVAAHFDTAIDSHRDASIRAALAPLHHLAERTEAAVLALAHLNKSQSTDLFVKVGGSIGMSAAPRSILLMASDHEAEEESPNRLLVHGKSNLSAPAPTLRFRAESRSIEGWEGEQIDTVGLAWLGEAPDVKASDVLSPTGGDDKSALDDAVEFLEGLLGEGPVGSKDVQRQADEVGVSRITLRRAKKARGVVVRKEGGHFGPGKQRWVWALPDDETEMTENVKSAEGDQETLKMLNSQTRAPSAIDDHLQSELTDIDSDE